MGADMFGTTARGKTASAAFAEATQQARYEHGHGGYTGTIAEKRSFVVFDPAVEAPQLIAKLEARRAQLTLSNQKRNAARVKACEAKWSVLSDSERDEIFELRNQVVIDPERLTSMRSWLTKQIKALRGKRSRPAAVASALLDVRDKRVDDKWGPAGCVEVSRGVWYFFGIASS